MPPPFIKKGLARNFNNLQAFSVWIRKSIPGYQAGFLAEQGNLKTPGVIAVVKKTFRYSKVFFYNHLYHPSEFRSLFFKRGIKGCP